MIANLDFHMDIDMNVSHINYIDNPQITSSKQLV